MDTLVTVRLSDQPMILESIKMKDRGFKHGERKIWKERIHKKTKKLYCMSKKSWPILYGNLLYEMG